MLNRILIVISTLIAIVHGVAPDAVPMEILPLLLVLLGLAYGVMNVDAEDATAFLVLAIAVGGAAMSNALGNIHEIGSYLDGILDALSIGLWGAVVSIFVTRLINRIMASDDGSGDSE